VDQPQFCDFPRTVMTPKCAINRFHLLLAQAYLTLLRQGAAHLMLQCVGPVNGNSLYRYVFNNWKDVEKIIRNGSKLGIATPLQSDQFKVYRFLLDGMAQSTNSIETSFFAAVQAGSNKSTTKPVKGATSEIL
jgi:hypothetical protein